MTVSRRNIGKRARRRTHAAARVKIYKNRVKPFINPTCSQLLYYELSSLHDGCSSAAVFFLCARARVNRSISLPSINRVRNNRWTWQFELRVVYARRCRCRRRHLLLRLRTGANTTEVTDRSASVNRSRVFRSSYVSRDCATLWRKWVRRVSLETTF